MRDLASSAHPTFENGFSTSEVRTTHLLRGSVNGPCTRPHRRPRTLTGSGVTHSGIIKNRKVRHSHAQTNSRGGQCGFLPVSSGRSCGPGTVVVDGLAGARARAVLGAHAGARRDTARRGADRADPGFRAFRRGGLRDTGTGRRTRASGCRRGVSLRPQPHVCGGTGVHRRSGVTPGPVRFAAVRGGRLACRRGVRALLRGTHPYTPLWRGLRGLPARGASLVASPASLGTRRAQQTRRRVMHTPTTVIRLGAEIEKTR